MLECLPLPGADLRLDRAWLAEREADTLFPALLDGLPWGNHPVRLFGREHPAPRLSCWMGDAAYRYSGLLRQPAPWTADLARLRDRLARELDQPFNSVLANLYRDGRDAMGWHADDERELGSAPVIASVSLGHARRFLLRSRDGSARLALDLPHGSLLVMAGATQANYRHALPRMLCGIGARINLTFRHVQAPP